MKRPGMVVRIGLVAAVPALVVLTVMSAATWILSRSLFETLMIEHGATSASAGAMFQETVGWVAVGALVAAVVISGAAAMLLGRSVAQPLRHLYTTARRLESGDLTARVGTRSRVPELAALADAFDTMAGALEMQEQVRRDFVTGAAHELLTPLTNLEGYLEGLRDGVIPPEPATFDSLLEEAHRLTRLSRALLHAARPPESSELPESVDLGRSVDAAAALLEPGMRRGGLTLELTVAPGTRVFAVPDQVTQILFNLLHNAIRYSKPGTVVRVAADPFDRQVRVTVSNIATGSVQLTERVFERFYRLDPSRDRATGGAGIGLAVVKDVVERSGGRVGVDTAEDDIRIWFTLPVGQVP
ncbi:MAG: sensor histidine kinase [Candidatus Dormibacteria bacterium]